MQIDRPITIALILFIILLLVFFLVAPEYNTFKKLQTDLGEKKAEYNAEFDYYAAITRTYQDLQSHKDDIEKIDDALPKEPALGKLVYFLQETAKENGLIVKDLFLSKSSPNNADNNINERVRDIIFSMDLLGDYASLEGLMASLEKSSRIFEIISISFNSPFETSSKSSSPKLQIQQTYSFSVQIKTYSY